LLKYITPKWVHIMQQGQIVKSGGMELVDALEGDGFDALLA
jgi:Fe-S cluster assembly ATP-binding protein